MKEMYFTIAGCKSYILSVNIFILYGLQGNLKEVYFQIKK